MLIITGLGRCGTSVLTLFLKEMGYKVTTDVEWWNDDVDAGLECNDFFRIVAEINQCIDAEKRDKAAKPWSSDLASKIKNYQCDVVKSIDFAYQKGMVLDMFHKMRGDDFSIAYCFRSPDKIIASRRARLDKLPTFVDKRRKLRPHMFYEDHLHFMEKMMHLRVRHDYFLFPDFLENYEETLYLLEDICLTGIDNGVDWSNERALDIWNRVVKKEMVHFG